MTQSSAWMPLPFPPSATSPSTSSKQARSGSGIGRLPGCPPASVPSTDTSSTYRRTDSTTRKMCGSITSANRCLAWLKAALNHAWREKKQTGVETNDEWSRVQPFPGVDVARARYLSPAECKRLINACEGDFRTLVHAALLTGARYGELARLRVADFNDENLHAACAQEQGQQGPAYRPSRMKGAPSSLSSASAASLPIFFWAASGRRLTRAIR